MRALIAAAIAVAVAGCAQVSAPAGATPAQIEQAQANALQANWLQSCLLYNGAQRALIANAGKLTNGQLSQALIITRQITPLCTAQPANLDDATQKITAAVTTITVMAGMNAINSDNGGKK